MIAGSGMIMGVIVMGHLMAAASSNFADDVLRELVVALGGALFLGNLLALIRRRQLSEDPDGLTRAPVARTLVYLLIGFVVMVWGIASLATR